MFLSAIHEFSRSSPYSLDLILSIFIFQSLGGYVLISLSGFYLNSFHGFMILSILSQVGFFVCFFFTLVSISLNLLPILLLFIFLKCSLYILILSPFSDIYMGNIFSYFGFFFSFSHQFFKKQNILNLVQSNNHFFLFSFMDYAFLCPN